MRGCILKVNSEELGVVIDSMFVYYFVDPDPGVEIFYANV